MLGELLRVSPMTGLGVSNVLLALGLLSALLLSIVLCQLARSPIGFFGLAPGRGKILPEIRCHSPRIVQLLLELGPRALFIREGCLNGGKVERLLSSCSLRVAQLNTEVSNSRLLSRTLRARRWRQRTLRAARGTSSRELRLQLANAEIKLALGSRPTIMQGFKVSGLSLGLNGGTGLSQSMLLCPTQLGHTSGMIRMRLGEEGRNGRLLLPATIDRKTQFASNIVLALGYLGSLARLSTQVVGGGLGISHGNCLRLSCGRNTCHARFASGKLSCLLVEHRLHSSHARHDTSVILSSRAGANSRRLRHGPCLTAVSPSLAADGPTRSSGAPTN